MKRRKGRGKAKKRGTDKIKLSDKVTRETSLHFTIVGNLHANPEDRPPAAVHLESADLEGINISGPHCCTRGHLRG